MKVKTFVRGHASLAPPWIIVVQWTLWFADSLYYKNFDCLAVKKSVHCTRDLLGKNWRKIWDLFTLSTLQNSLNFAHGRVHTRAHWQQGQTYAHKTLRYRQTDRHTHIPNTCTGTHVLFDRHTHTRAHWQQGQTYAHTDTNRQTDRQTDTHIPITRTYAHRRINRQTHTSTHRHLLMTDSCTCALSGGSTPAGPTWHSNIASSCRVTWSTNKWYSSETQSEWMNET